MTDVPIRVSSKWARHLFACSLEYIKSTCHGGCCQGTDCIKVALTEIEAAREVGQANVVKEGLLQPNPLTGLCPYKQHDGLCALHGSTLKFLGCRVSPFKVNASGTVIIRHRYVQMRCHGHGRPAYQVFNASLVAMFGETEAGRITSLLDDGSGDVDAIMPGAIAKALHELEGESWIYRKPSNYTTGATYRTAKSSSEVVRSAASVVIALCRRTVLKSVTRSMDSWVTW